MADTTTPNIGLLVADPNDVVSYTSHIGNNLSTIDSFMGLPKCTSLTRPSTTYGGQGIYETDTKRVAVNTGTAGSGAVWTYVSHQALSATSSARPTLGLTPGEQIYETDTTLVRVRGASTWLGELLSCTVGTLPANPLAGDVVYLSDKECLARYTGSQWRTTGPVICTSSTHPTSSGITLYAGMQIYETDTELTAVYNGSAFLYPAQQIAATQILGGNTASITFSGLSSAYATVSVSWSARDNSGNASDALKLRLNGDSASHYLWQFVQGNNTTASAAVSTSDTSIQAGVCAGGAATAGYYSGGTFDIEGWSSAASGRFATVAGHSYVAAGNGAAGQIAGAYGGTYQPTAALTSITLLPAAGSFVATSEFSVRASM